MSGHRYQRLSVEQTLHKVPLSAERGSVFDRNGRDLALSVQLSTVYADPTLVVDPLGYRGQARAGPARRVAVPREATRRAPEPLRIPGAHRAATTSSRRCAQLEPARDRLRARVGSAVSRGDARGFAPRSRRCRRARPRRHRIPLQLAPARLARRSSWWSRTSTASTFPDPAHTRSTRGAAPTSCSRSTSPCSGRPSSRSSTR